MKMKINKLIKNLSLIFVLMCSIMSVSYAANANDDYAYSKLTETLLNQDPDPVEPGDYVELRFKVEKEGNEELNNIEYELVPEYPFSFDGSDTPIKKLGDWIGTSDTDEYYILYYKLKVDENALEGNYELTMYQTSDETSSRKEIKFDIRVDDKETPNLIVGNVVTSPNKLIANYDEGLIKVEIVNVGDEAAEQVIVDLAVPKGFEESFGYSTRANIGTIGAGESKYAEFYLDTNEGLVKGEKASTLLITYKEDDDDQQDEVKTIVRPFNISIFGRPEYELIDYETVELTPGKTDEIKLKVRNIGSGSSDSTSIQVFKDSSQPFDFEDKSDFIGSMDVNEEGEVVFNVETDADADPKEYKLKLQVRSVVDGDVLTEDETINVNVVSQNDVNPAENMTIRFAIYAILLILGLIVGYRYGLSRAFKKEKLSKK